MNWLERREYRVKKFRDKLHPLYLPIYDFLVLNLPTYWAPYFGWRSIMEQDALYMQGRDLPGKVITRARGGESAHNFGCASDWTIFNVQGEPIWEHQEWEELGDMAERAGARWGGTFRDFKDKPHVELPISVNWKISVAEKLKEEGMEAALKLIESTFIGQRQTS